MKPLHDELVDLSDHVFGAEVSHALALFGHAPDPDLTYSEAAVRRFGRPRPAVMFASPEAPLPAGMRVSFGSRSIARLEVFYENERLHGRRPHNASIRTSRLPQGESADAFADPARSSVTEHALSYLIRNDLLRMQVPLPGEDLTEWTNEVRRVAHYVSDMRRRPDRISLDGQSTPVVRIEDPMNRWAVVVLEHGRYRVTIAGRPSFLDLEFVSTDGHRQACSACQAAQPAA